VTAARRLAFVQFPHPGGEHNPRTEQMPWNTDQHRRKFLVTRGRYVDADECTGEADLAFWGEWEAPSRVARRWPVAGRMPRALHRPYWYEPETNGYRQNTDPWVFGERMIYSNCKQVIGRSRRPTSMQSLARGSVICFGSTIDGEFCVDTVFVVASREPWVPVRVDDLEIDEAFKTCTGGSVATRQGDAHMNLTLYRGATVEDPVEGMFSFVPAAPAEADDPRFLRPSLESRFINAASRQSTWGSKRLLAMDTVRDAWQDVRHQVLGGGLMLAVGLRTPEHVEVT
jgi:hypothetical protein